MNNKQRREIIENAKASGYDGSYVDLFRDPAAPLKLAVTQEERMKGLKPYNEPGGQAMALPNNPPNNPVNTIGARPPIRTKSVGSKVGSAPVAPGISSFKGVVTAGDLRARGKYGRRRAEEGTQRPPEASAAAARPDFANMGLPITADDVQVPNVPVNGTPVKDFLDRAQIALGTASLAAGATGVGEVVSVPADLVNAAISFGRAGYYGIVEGDPVNAAKYAGLGGLNVAAAIPVIGNVAGAASVAKTAQALSKTKAVSKTSHMMHHGGEAAITAGKTADYMDLGDKALNVIKNAPRTNVLSGPKFKAGGYTNRFGGIRRRSLGGPGGPEEDMITGEFDAQYIGNQNLMDVFAPAEGEKRISVPEARKRARQDTMRYAVGNFMSHMIDTSTGKFRREDDPQAAMYINNMFKNVGKPELNSVDAPWSAATVSHFAKQIDPEFQGSALHADYINRAFQGEGNYKSKKTKGTKKYEVGDILFRGRGDTKGWAYKDFKQAGRKGQRYSSHSDIIVGTGVDENGKTYYEVIGGNMGGQYDESGNPIDGTQTTKLRRLYPNNIAATYQGAMVETGKSKRSTKTKIRRARKRKAR